MLALNAICAERDVSKDVVLDAIEVALQTAYRRDFEHEPNISVSLDRTTGDARVFIERKVVEEVEDDILEIGLEEARARFGPQIELGDSVREERTPRNFGRIAAQTAKQVIVQRIREAERDRMFFDFANREGEIVMGTVQSVDSKNGAVRLSMGKAEAVLPRSEQLPGERYRVGQRVRAYLSEVNRASKGPQIVVSRTHRHMLRRLLELEVPEIANGTVEIRAIAREAGARSKVAVAAMQPGIDPVGACVGMKGTRIQSIVNELNGEKIDVVQWSPDEAIYVANSLSPAKVIEAFLEEDNEEGKTAIVVVPDKQLSLAIGKEGQNARLAAKLTGWRIDIKSASEAAEERVRLAEREARRREEESRRRAEEEERLAAARALLAEAESAEAEPQPDELAYTVAADAIAFGEEQPEQPTAVAPAEAEAPVEAEVQAEAPAVAEAVPPAPAEQPRPTAQPQPAAQPQPPVAPAKPTSPPTAQPAPQPTFDEEEEWEDEEEEITPSAGKSKAPMIFYTLNARGEAESLDDMVERRQKDKWDKKKKKKGGDGKPRRARRPWSDDDNW